MGNDKITYGDRIRQLREGRGISQELLAIKTGYANRSSIARIESNEVDLSMKRLKTFANALHTNVAYLLGWTGDSSASFMELDPEIVVQSYRVPIVGQIACGQPLLAEQNYSGYFATDGRIKADYCLQAKGESMIDVGIGDGDYVFIKYQQEVENGEIAVVLIDGETTLKRFYKQDEYVVLKPCNDAFPPMIYSHEFVETNSFQVIGKCVGVLHSLDGR